MLARHMAIDIRAFTTWSPAEAEAGATLKKFGIDKLFQKVGIELTELFGELPDVFVHNGDLALKDHVHDADGHGF
jgi:hypothetical protein